MRNRSSRPRLPGELNQRAKAVVDRLTRDRDAEAEPTPQAPDPISEAAAQLGRCGGLKGGVSRAKKLSKKKLSEIAKKAAQARWKRTSK